MCVYSLARMRTADTETLETRIAELEEELAVEKERSIRYSGVRFAQLKIVFDSPVFGSRSGMSTRLLHEHEGQLRRGLSIPVRFGPTRLSLTSVLIEHDHSETNRTSAQIERLGARLTEVEAEVKTRVRARLGDLETRDETTRTRLNRTLHDVTTQLRRAAVDARLHKTQRRVAETQRQLDDVRSASAAVPATQGQFGAV